MIKIKVQKIGPDQEHKFNYINDRVRTNYRILSVLFTALIKKNGNQVLLTLY